AAAHGQVSGTRGPSEESECWYSGATWLGHHAHSRTCWQGDAGPCSAALPPRLDCLVGPAPRAHLLLNLLSLGSRLVGGQHLIRQSAGQLCQVIEGGGERADTRRRRSQLDDQIVHLGRGDLRLHDVPAGPALATVEAEDLSAPLRDERVDLRSRVRRNGYHDSH